MIIYDEGEERYDARFEAGLWRGEEQLKEKMNMTDVYFWRDQFDKDQWHIGTKYKNSYNVSCTMYLDSFSETFGGDLVEYVRKKFEQTGKPVSVQMGWLP